MPRNGKVIPSDNPIAQEMMAETGWDMGQIAWRHNGTAGALRQADKCIGAVLNCVSASDESRYYAEETLKSLNVLRESMKKRKDQQT